MPVETFPTLEYIRVADIRIGYPMAQRDQGDRKRDHNAKRIAARFDLRAFQAPTVVRMPDGSYHPCDGWTRTTAARLARGDDFKIPCWVVTARNSQEAAEIFTEISGNRTQPSALASFNIKVEAREPEASAIMRIITGLGLKLGGCPSSTTIAALSTVTSVYREGGADALLAVLTTVRACWEPTPDSWDGSIIRGWHLFLRKYGEHVHVKHLAQKMTKTYGSAGVLLGKAKALREAAGVSLAQAVMDRIVQTHDAGRRERLADIPAPERKRVSARS